MALELTFGVDADTLAEGFDHEPFELIEAILALRRRLLENSQWEEWLESLTWELNKRSPEVDAEYRAMLQAMLNQDRGSNPPAVTDEETGVHG